MKRNFALVQRALNNRILIHMPFRLVAGITLLCFITGCDIPHVAEGSWDIVYELPGGDVTAVWHVDENAGLQMEGDLVFDSDEFELVGSRLSWSAEAPSPLIPEGSVERLNFNGTINGNRFAGTLFTQAGNLTVSGQRR